MGNKRWWLLGGVGVVVTSGLIGALYLSQTTEPGYYNDQNDNNLTHEITDEILRSSPQLQVKVTLERSVRQGYGISSNTIQYLSAGVALLDKDYNHSYVLSVAHAFPEEGTTHMGIPITNLELTVESLGTSIAKIDKDKDLLLLKINGSLKYHFQGKIAKDYFVNDFVTGLGYPGHLATYRGHLSGDDGEKLVFDAHINPGNSGGGVFAINNHRPVLLSIIQEVRTDMVLGHARGIRLEDLQEFVTGTEVDEYLPQ